MAPESPVRTSYWSPAKSHKAAPTSDSSPPLNRPGRVVPADAVLQVAARLTGIHRYNYSHQSSSVRRFKVRPLACRASPQTRHRAGMCFGGFDRISAESTCWPDSSDRSADTVMGDKYNRRRRYVVCLISGVWGSLCSPSSWRLDWNEKGAWKPPAPAP